MGSCFRGNDGESGSVGAALIAGRAAASVPAAIAARGTTALIAVAATSGWASGSSLRWTRSALNWTLLLRAVRLTGMVRGTLRRTLAIQRPRVRRHRASGMTRAALLTAGCALVTLRHVTAGVVVADDVAARIGIAGTATVEFLIVAMTLVAALALRLGGRA